MGRGRGEGATALRIGRTNVGLQDLARREHARGGRLVRGAPRLVPGVGAAGGWAGCRPGRPVALTEHVVRTKGAEVRKLSVKVRELTDTFALGSTDI